MGTLKIKSCESFPAGVILFGNVVAINVGERSPEWINVLASNGTLLRKLLIRLLAGEVYEEIHKEITKAVEEKTSSLYWD
jgi:hypothetical protein